jgi:hypothetical protein
MAAREQAPPKRGLSYSSIAMRPRGLNADDESDAPLAVFRRYGFVRISTARDALRPNRCARPSA